RKIMRPGILVILAACLLAACSTGVTRAEFDKTLEHYNELVRWRELDRAALFAAPSVSGEFNARVEDARNARVIEYQVIDVKYDEKAREALATVTYKYYSLATGLVHEMKDTQKWKYIDQKDLKGWRLESLLPEFR
ncbi:MAG: hypothetical protein M0Z60_11495, partial [Nitrospiraceae bacterium]|nr:hypothetical protein [Nitrospiraceae bacterium]